MSDLTPDRQTVMAYPAARCQHCGRVEPLFGPDGTRLVTALPALGWVATRDANGGAVWECPGCVAFISALLAGPQGGDASTGQ